MYVLAIDGGGTKTKGVIASSKGDIIAEAVVGPSNPNSVDEADLHVEFVKLFDALKSQGGGVFAEISRVFAGISGADHPIRRKELQSLLSDILGGAAPVTVHNDAITALYSGTFGAPGIVQIAGTGSITYGINVQGNMERVGGWGYLLGEKGSGYALGSEGLAAAFSAYDQLGRETELVQLMMDHFQVRQPQEIVAMIYQAKNQKEIIASFGKVVVKAANQDDAVSLDIVNNNATYLGASISCLIKKLFANQLDKIIPVVLTGGVFNCFDLLKEPMEDALRANNIKAKFIVPNVEPVIGAVVAALLEEGMVMEDIKESLLDK